MGYANDTLKSTEWKPVCSQFIKIGSTDGSDMTLGELVPGGGWTIGKTDRIKVLTKDATLDFDAYYLPAWAELGTYQRGAKAAGFDETTWKAGWYKIVDNKLSYTDNMNATPLPFGSCILAYTTTTGAYLTSNGEVCQPEDSKIIHELVSTEWKFVGNCTPVSLTLGDFVPGNGWTIGKTDRVKVLTKDATLDFDAYYLPSWTELGTYQRGAKAAGFDETTWKAGWYKIVDNKLSYTDNMNATPVVPGAGVLAYSTTTGATISIPSAL